MKSQLSRFVLAAEILTIILFHTVKIKQAENHTSDTAFMRVTKNMPLHKTAVENKSGVEYMLMNMLK